MYDLKNLNLGTLVSLSVKERDWNKRFSNASS